MSLESRAARASRSLRRTVSDLAPVGMPAVVRRQRLSTFASLAAAAAMVLVFAGIASAMPSFFEPEQVAATDPSLPEPDGSPTVIEPDDQESNGELVEMEQNFDVVPVRQMVSESDLPSPWTKFYGDALPGTTVIAVSDWGSADLVVDERGEFSLKLEFEPLPPAGLEFPILLTVGSAAYEFHFTSLWDPGNVDITAHQLYGISDDIEAYEKFFGTAPPGLVISAESPYGSATTTSGDSGKWNLKLWFDDLPIGEPFDVIVRIADEVFTFGFVSVYEPPPLPISVSQANSTSDSSSPWVKFIVDGPVGTVVDISSSYGSVSRTMTGTNEYVKLWFSSLPPAGVEFPVTVKIDGEVWGTYAFTSWYEEPAPIAKTANSTYGSCSEDPPYDVYYGTAPAGTNVDIASAYGSGATTADGSGNWSKQVFFAGAPLNEVFTVTVTVGAEVFTFDMVVIG